MDEFMAMVRARIPGVLAILVVGALTLASPALALRWAPIPVPQTPLAGATLTELSDGKVLLAGGINGSPTANAFVFDPHTLTWSATGSMHTARAYHTATRLNDGEVLVAGGLGEGGVLSSSELYDQATETWTMAASMSHGLLGGRWKAEATLLGNGDVLVTDGLEQKGKLDVWPEIYVPAPTEGAGHDEWFFESSEHLPARYQAGLVTLRDGRALLAGGATSLPPSSPLSSAEIYEPTNGWSATKSMDGPRDDFLLTTLSNGDVMASGGGAGTEVYDPTLGTWRAAPELLTGPDRLGLAGTELSDGRLLAVGGCTLVYPGGNTADTETFDPVANTWSDAGELPAPRAQALVSGLGQDEALVVGGYEQPYSGYCNVQPSGLIDNAAAWPAPTTTIISSPTGSTTSTGATLTFTADLTGSTFSCSLDSAAPSACSSPVTLQDLALGPHTFSVVATSPGGLTDPTPPAAQWMVVAAPSSGSQPQTAMTPTTTTQPPPPSFGPPLVPSLLFGGATVASSNSTLSSNGVADVREACPADAVPGCDGHVSLTTLQAVVARAHRKAKPLLLGWGSFTIPAGKAINVPVRISSRGISLVKRKRELRVKATTTTTDGSGISKTTAAVLILRATRIRQK